MKYKCLDKSTDKWFSHLCLPLKGAKKNLQVKFQKLALQLCLHFGYRTILDAIHSIMLFMSMLANIKIVSCKKEVLSVSN